MFIATLLVIALNGKHPQYSLSGTRINDCTISICTVECHSAVEWVNYWFAQNCDEPLKHYPEQSKSPVRVYCAIPFTWNSITTQINPQWHKAAGVAGEGGREIGSGRENWLQEAVLRATEVFYTSIVGRMLMYCIRLSKLIHSLKWLCFTVRNLREQSWLSHFILNMEERDSLETKS